MVGVQINPVSGLPSRYPVHLSSHLPYTFQEYNMPVEISTTYTLLACSSTGLASFRPTTC